MARYRNGLEFAMPTPLHALRPGSVAAVESIRRYAHERNLERVVSSLVTDHGRPPVAPFEGDVFTAAARRLEADAAARGWKTNVIRLADRCVVEGVRGDAAFRATWKRGRADKATWHEKRERYAMIHDTRPIGVGKISRVGLEGKRPAGVAEHHLVIVASPRGVPIAFPELTKRVKS